jgi:hypothetical protein
VKAKAPELKIPKARKKKSWWARRQEIKSETKYKRGREGGYIELELELIQTLKAHIEKRESARTMWVAQMQIAKKVLGFLLNFRPGLWLNGGALLPGN